MKYPTFKVIISMYSFKSHITKSVFFSTFVSWRECHFHRNLKKFWCASPFFSFFNDFQSDFCDQFLNISKVVFQKRVYLPIFVENIEELFQIFPIVIG